jgi:PST family polysaccharide transporter
MLYRNPALTPQEMSGSFWLLLAAGVAGFGISVAANGPLDRVFGTPGIGAIIAVQSSMLLFLPFRTLGQAVLSREMLLDEISKREVGTTLLRIALSVGMALRGWGVWSLVVPQIVGEMAFSLSCYRRAGWRVTGDVAWREMGPLVRFGVDITLSRIVWFVSSRADQFIVGRLLGPTGLGLYAIAQQFAGAVPQFVSATVSRVVFPAFSRLQHDMDGLRRTFLAVTRYTAFATAPAFAGLVLVAPELFAVILKPSWAPAVPALQFLAPLAFLKIQEAIAGFLVNARAGTRRMLVLNVLNLALTMVASAAGAHLGGLTGLAAALLVGFVPVVLLVVRMTMRECGGGLSQWLATLRAPAAATVAMSLAVLLAGALLPAGAPLLRLVTLVAVGLVAYPVAALAVGPDILVEVRRLRSPGLEPGSR